MSQLQDLPVVPLHLRHLHTDDQVSLCPSVNSRKDSGIRSTSRRSSIQHQVGDPRLFIGFSRFLIRVRLGVDDRSLFTSLCICHIFIICLYVQSNGFCHNINGIVQLG